MLHKPKIVIRLFALAAAIAVLACWPARAQTTLRWDANATGTGPSDGPGDWTSTTTWWNGSSDVSWTDGPDVVFGAGGGGDSVNLSAPIAVNSLTMNAFSGTYQLGGYGVTMTLTNGITNNASAGATTIISPLTLAAAQTWLNNSTNPLTVSEVDNGGYLLSVGGSGSNIVSGSLSDTGGLTMNGTGTLTLAGANSYSGDTTVNAGTLVANGSSAVAGTANLTVAGGATLVLSGSLAGTAGGGNAWPPAIVTGAGTVRMPLGGLSNVGLDLDLSGLTGVLDLTNGMMALLPYYSPGFVGPTNGTIKLENGTTLYLGWSGLVLNATVALYGGTDNGEGYGSLRGDSATLNGGVILGTNSTIGCAGTGFTINGVISDGGSGYGFTEVQNGTVTLTASNTYSGPTKISSGTLVCSTNAALGNTSLLNLGGSAVVKLNYTGTHVVPTLILGGVGQPAGVYGSSSSTAPAANQSAYFAGTGTITVVPPPSLTVPTLTWDANGTGAGVVDGGGSWLNTTNTWWNGQANVNWVGTNNAVFGSGGTGGTITVGSVTNGQVVFTNFSGTYTLTNGALTVANNVTVANSAGNVQIYSALGGNGGIVMNGSGTLTLAGANTYAGQTVVNAGTLVAISNSAVAATTLFNVASGATLSLTQTPSAPAYYHWGPATVRGAGTLSMPLNGRTSVCPNYNLGAFTGILDITNGSLCLQPGQVPNFASPTNGIIKVENNTTLYLGWGATAILNSTVKLYGGTAGMAGYGQLRGDNGTLNGALILMTNSSIGAASGYFTNNEVISDGGLGYGFTKVAAGTVILTASNSYSGPTTISAGTLQCNTPYALGTGGPLTNIAGVLNLNYTGTHFVSALTLGGVAQPIGTYGSSSSDAPAANQSASFAGTGTVTVPGPAQIIAFTVPGALSVSIDPVTLTIVVGMPARTDLTKLAPIYSLSSGTCVPASGSTQNFTSPVIYTATDVVAMITNAYTVTVTEPASYYWAGPNGGNWTAAANWDNTVPGPGIVPVFSDTASAGATVNLDADVMVPGLIFNNLVANQTIASTAGHTLTLSNIVIQAGTLAITCPIDATANFLKESGAGTLNLGGALRTAKAPSWDTSVVNGSVGIVLSGTGSWTDTSAAYLDVGSVSGAGALTINDNATLDWSASWALCVAFNSGETGKVVQNGGTVITPAAGTAWWNNNGPGVMLGDNASGASTAEYDLNGGTLVTPNIYNIYENSQHVLQPPPGSAIFRFNGGVLKATQNDNLGNADVVTEGTTNLMGNLTHAYVGLGGAKMDVAAFSCGINQALEHDPALGATLDGGLHAMSTGGPGTLALYQLSTFTGPLAIDPGVTVNLGYTGNQRVASVSIDGVNQGTGTFGVGHSNPGGVFTGPGTVTVLPPAPAPVLPTSSFSRPGGVPTFTGIATVSGYTYYLVWKNNLTDASWTPITPGTTGTGGAITLTDPSPNAQHRFYRIATQ